MERFATIRKEINTFLKLLEEFENLEDREYWSGYVSGYTEYMMEAFVTLKA
jgi:hypothetical protein